MFLLVRKKNSRLDFFSFLLHPQGALNINERTIPQPRLLQLSVEKLSREGAFLMDTGMVRCFQQEKCLLRACVNPQKASHLFFSSTVDSSERLSRLDVVGILIFTVTLTLLIFALFCSNRWCICGLDGTATPSFSHKSWGFPTTLPCLIT